MRSTDGHQNEGSEVSVGENMGWEHEPELEPDPAGETEQLQLLHQERERPPWSATPAERRAGLEALRRIREAQMAKEFGVSPAAVRRVTDELRKRR